MNTSPLLDLLSHTALKGAVVLLLALLLGLVLRRTAAARRYALWITAVATLSVLPLAMWILPAWHVLPKAAVELEWPVMELEPTSEIATPVLPAEKRTVTVPDAKPVRPMPSQVTAPPAFSRNISWQDVVAVLPVAWMLIAVLLLLRLMLSAWRLHRLEKSLRPGECAVLNHAARELGLKRMPRLLIGPTDSVPMVWGVLNPRLLLPEGFETWSDEKQRGVLLHELAHLKRGDPLALWAAQWVKALHWFNPLVWLTLRQLRADQERACDDAVLRHGVRASDYAQSLLDLSRHNRLAPGLSLCALTITRCAPVEARVKAILDPKRRREGLTLRWLGGLAGGALFITLPVAMLHAIEGPQLRGRILDRNGVVLAESTQEKVRHYPFKALVTRVTGYTGGTGPGDATPTGRTAIEKQHNAELKEGRDVVLSLDALVQLVVQKGALTGNVRRGGMVIMDPETGGILAYVSLPDYDANRFIPTHSRADWEALSQDIDNPLLDRVSSARSAPGAIFQPFTALAALRAGKTPGTYACTPLTRGSGGGVRYGSVTRICRTSLREGAAHGPLTLEQALAKGCFSYFFQLGTEVGYPALFSMAEDLGLQQGTNIFGVKSPPLLPAMEELAKTRSSQRQLNDITTDFASGRASPATVLQMAVLYSALANGKVWEPSLTKKSAGRPRLDLNTLPGLPEGLARVRSALREAVIHPQPWARSLTSSKAQIAALADSYATGAKGPHSEVFTHHYWMAGYAPADKPALAFALCVDETSPDSTLVPDKLGTMVRRIVEETLALPADGSGEVKPVEDKSAAAPTKFDFDAGETSRQIKALSAEAGIFVKEFKMSQGKVTVLGEATGMIPARKYLFKLLELGGERNVRWAVPRTKALGNQSVQFEASGTYGSAASNDAAPAPKAATPPKSGSQVQIGLPVSDDAIRLQPELAKQWTHLKAAGLLADLPAEAVVISTDTARLEQYVRSKQMLFRFSLPREAARRWLVDSVFVEDQREKLLKWPKTTASFHDTFTAANNCKIIVSCQKGETVHVMIFQPQEAPGESQKLRPLQKLRPFRPMLIAPDESQEPRPAGGLAPEYHGKGFSQGAAMPALDLALQSLRPTISHEEARMPTFRPQQGQLRLQAAESTFRLIINLPFPLNRFKGELSEESQKALLRSYLQEQGRSFLSSNRMQQALIVKSPKA